MDRNRRPSGWDELPDEILLQIIAYLKPYHITRLQLVSRKLQKLCLDDELWKQNCFDDSPWFAQLQSWRGAPPVFFGPAPDGENAQEAVEGLQDVASSPSGSDRAASQAILPADNSKHRRAQKWQDMANWDPAFPTERVSWYDEFIQRYGPASISWLQTPRIRDRGMEAIIESRGVALYNPYNGRDGDGTMLAVSPLDDGSVCLWDIKGTRGRQGSIIGCSKPDILFIDGPGGQNQRRSKRIDTGVTECVSVNHHNNRAFFAVQSHLIEVDLNRLQVVSRQSFEWSITTMSAINEGLPLTVGTSLGIHLHDFRTRANIPNDRSERVEWDEWDVYKSIFDPKPLPPYASLSQPTPISILHLPKPGSHSQVSDDIFVSGRFTNILHYDRRKFPAIVGSIYSGGLIKSLAAVPYPYSTVDYEVRRHGEFPAEQISRIKRTGSGVTMIAGGVYKLKGSLEIIVFSDGNGLIKWFERDGFTECRRHKIGSCDAKENNIFASSGRGEIARKIVSTKSSVGHNRSNNDDILFWTGERLGMLSFTATPLYLSEDFEPPLDVEAATEDGKRQQYAEEMREALERQTDEIQLMSRFGHGPT
ncbi:F-box domain-containing protein [Cordyceps javanica]|uniref:F-box domain-containing protein n=1 Tax=Cordyceps javanica TaxID=43265 RepID=A0A545VA00_9HYPO|nr:F-box domain-containing protein [Cordyceps javanica]TQW09775.1 F-box domain containing protein [Cordyceps javanica]